MTVTERRVVEAAITIHWDHPRCRGCYCLVGPVQSHAEGCWAERLWRVLLGVR